MVDLVKNYAITTRHIKGSIIRELLKLTNKPGVISFAGGLPDPHAFPIEWLEEVAVKVLRENSKAALQYGPTEGLAALKHEIVKHSKKLGENIKEENILVTTASQQGLELLGKVFIDPSDPIICELPSYIGGLQVFNAYSAKLIGVPMDDRGIKVDKLEDVLTKLQKEEERYKFLYLVPDFQNPSGVTLAEDRRKKILDLSNKFNFLVVEDSPYSEIRFEGKAPPTLQSLDKCKNVITLRTFSKIFVPGFRLGWVVANADIISKMSLAKQAMDLCTSSFCQLIAAKFCELGYLDKQIELVSKRYKEKRGVMLDALQKYMPADAGVRWTKPEGGLFLWLELPKHVSMDDMFLEAIEEKVAYVIGSAFHCDGSGTNTARLNFSFPTLEEIDEGIKRLGNLIKKKLVSKK